MPLLQELHRKEKEIVSVGLRIREEAKKLGAPFCYMDPSMPGFILIEQPDGTKEFKPISDDSAKRKIRS
jgi:hypothetical protein